MISSGTTACASSNITIFCGCFPMGEKNISPLMIFMSIACFKSSLDCSGSSLGIGYRLPINDGYRRPSSSVYA